MKKNLQTGLIVVASAIGGYFIINELRKLKSKPITKDKTDVKAVTDETETMKSFIMTSDFGKSVKNAQEVLNKMTKEEIKDVFDSVKLSISAGTLSQDEVMNLMKDEKNIALGDRMNKLKVKYSL